MTTVMMTESPKTHPERIYFRIGDVAEIVGVKPYVLRFWESEFPMIAPEKSTSGQRVYRRVDVETLLLIKKLLYADRYSIEGARKRMKELRREGLLQAERKAVWDGAATGSSGAAESSAEAVEAVIHFETGESTVGSEVPNAGSSDPDLRSLEAAAKIAAPDFHEAMLTDGTAGKVRQLALEISLLAKRPVSEFFRY